MKKNLLVMFAILLSITANAQVKKVKVDWKDVQVYELSEEKIAADSVGLPKAEWGIDGEASSMSELSPAELITIKKKAAKFGCNIAYVDVRKVYGTMKGEIFVLGFYKK